MKEYFESQLEWVAQEAAWGFGLLPVFKTEAQSGSKVRKILYRKLMESYALSLRACIKISDFSKPETSSLLFTHY